MGANKDEHCEDASGYWTVGIQYLHLTASVVEEIIKQGNPWVIITEHSLSLDDHMKRTKWADYNLIIPLLFDFYHGIEVLLKGFLIAAGVKAKRNHKLSDLHREFNENYHDNALSQYIERYVVQERLPQPLSSFCEECKMSMDEYYQALKYPESTGGKVYRHFSLKYQDTEGLPFFKTMLDDIGALRKEVVSLGKAACENV